MFSLLIIMQPCFTLLNADSRVGDLRKAIAARYASISTYSVELLLVTSIVAESQSQPIKLLDQMSYTGDSFGRMLVSITGQSAHWKPSFGPSPPARTWVGAFDGKLGKTMHSARTKTGELQYSLRVSARPDSINFKPADLVASINGTPIVALMDQINPNESSLSVRNFTEENNRISELTTVTKVTMNNEPTVINTVLTFHLTRGCALAKHQISFRRPKDKQDETTFLAEFKDWVSIGGVHVAQTVLESHWDLLPESGRVFRRSVSVECKNWKINQPLPNNWYIINVPVGSLVNDETRGKSYIEGMVDDKSLAKAAAVASKIYESNSETTISPPLSRPQSISYTQIASLVIGSVAAILLIFFFWRRSHA